jgi:hypothetical protein
LRVLLSEASESLPTFHIPHHPNAMTTIKTEP